MPIDNERFKEANRRMLGKTNRAILFAKVNTDDILDPDLPEDDQELTPSLERMLAAIDNYSPEAFNSEVSEKLTVTSFKEFLDKFKPGFYYRVAPPRAAEDAADAYDAGGEAGEGEATAEDDSPTSQQLEFSLDGSVKSGWKKVTITPEHPYIRCLTNLIKQRVKQDTTAFRVDVDAALMGFKPKPQRAMMRKLAEDVQVKNDRLMLEAKRNPGSKDTAKALEAYQAASLEFQGALEDSVRVLPTVVYGLEQTAKELKKLGGGGGPVDTNVYEIEFGTNRKMIATPRKVLAMAGQAVMEARALAAGTAASAKALGAGEKQAAALEAGAETNGATSDGDETALAKTEAGGDLAKTDASKAIVKQTLTGALDKLREENVKYANVAIGEQPSEKRFPLVVGKFMDQMINRGLVAPLMGNMLAVVLQNPKELALLSPDVKDVEVFHDMFLGVYSSALEDFLKAVTPLFETIMGVYLLFNEFPAEIKLPESMKPQLIIANSDLPDLILTRETELKQFFEWSNLQANNQFQHAVSFAIVPNVAPLKKPRPKKKSNKPVVTVTDDPIMQGILEAQANAANADSSGYGAVTYVGEMMTMMEWGSQFGFQTLFCPEERIKAGGVTKSDYYFDLAEAYGVESVIEKQDADSLIMCVPDFSIMPPDGKLVTGKTSDGSVEVGVDVPELTARSCYVAAGRLMANDVPAYLQRKVQRAKKDPMLVNMELPGVGIDLANNPFLGETDLPTDHFLGDMVMEGLLSPGMPFAVFTHVAGRSPFLSVPRTMRKVNNADGTTSFRHLHLFRQERYLRRLFRAAHGLDLNPAFPEDNAEAEAEVSENLGWLLQWAGWYKDGKLFNSFPSKVNSETPFTVSRSVGNKFAMKFNFAGVMTDPFDMEF